MYLAYIFCYALLVALASSATFTPPDILWLDENEVCKNSIFPEKRHACKVLDDCKTAIEDIRDNVKYPTICSFKGKMPVVCCAPESVSREERLAQEVDNVPKVSPGMLLHYKSYKDDNMIRDNVITYSRPRLQILSRKAQKRE